MATQDQQLATWMLAASAGDLNSEAWFERIREEVAHLLQEDFEGLVQLLYRFDVREDDIRHALAQLPQSDADLLIATLLVQRRLEALHMRKNMGVDQPRPDPADPEAW